MTGAPFARILLYHGVTASGSAGIENFSGKHVHADTFARQMRYLSENTSLFPLRELAQMLAARQPLPENAVAVTFDDTFENNYTVALPILRRYGVPATFFVTTGFVGTDRGFWVDQVEHALNHSSAEMLSIRIAGEPKQYSLAGREARIAAVVDIKRHAKRLAPKEREALLQQLFAAAGADGPPRSLVANYRNLVWSQVRGLCSPPEYEVGGHTVNHEILAYLSRHEIEYEVRACTEALKAELGLDIDLFAYPEGQAEHFNDEVIGVLKQNGIIICPTAISGVNFPGTDPFLLKREMVGFMGSPFPFPLP